MQRLDNLQSFGGQRDPLRALAIDGQKDAARRTKCDGLRSSTRRTEWDVVSANQHVRTNIYVTKKLYDLVKNRAEVEHRSFSKQLEFMLRDVLKKEGKLEQS